MDDTFPLSSSAPLCDRRLLLLVASNIIEDEEGNADVGDNDCEVVGDDGGDTCPVLRFFVIVISLIRCAALLVMMNQPHFPVRTA